MIKTFVCVGMLCAVALCASLVWAADKPLDFSGQDLPGADFSKRRLEKANFEDAVLKKANFVEALAMGANFQGADLTNVDFARADLTGADFRGATISAALFFKTTLNDANLEKADFSGTSMSGVKLRKANLKQIKGITSVIDVDFSEADLRGANLVGMSIVGTVRFRKAKYDSQTRWPKGFNVEASGAVLVENEDPPATKQDNGASNEPGEKPVDKKLERDFADLDSNEDGRLSGKELRGLEGYDKNKDGRVTLEEFVAGRKKE